MPRRGYRTIGSSSLPDEYIEAIEKLKKDPKFRAEMKSRGIVKISRALVIRIALLDLLKNRGFDITEISEAEDKEH